MKIDQNGKKYSPKCNKTYLETRRKWYGKLRSKQIGPSRYVGKECGR